MADQIIAYDPDQDPGERFAPEVRTEIAFVAPSTVVNGSITTAKLADSAVITGKLAAGAVTSEKIATNGVDIVNIAPGAVTDVKLATNAVTPEKCGTGVPTCVDESDNATEVVFKFMTNAQYAALQAVDPNTVYILS